MKNFLLGVIVSALLSLMFPKAPMYLFWGAVVVAIVYPSWYRAGEFD